MSAYFTLDDLRNRIGARTVAAVFDDDDTGDPDTSPVAALIEDASSKVDSYLSVAYRLPLQSTPNEVKRLALDVAVALAAQRHPEAFQRDWQKLMEAAERDLGRLRDGKTRLASAEGIDVPRNEGGGVSSDEVVDIDGDGIPDVGVRGPIRRVFVDGMGDF